MVDYSTFCIRPWNELHIEEDGRITPCCVMPSSLGFYPPKGIKNYLNSTELKKLKKDLKNGIKSEFCDCCWMHEKLGVPSHRRTVLNKQEKLDKISAVHLRSTNICNFKCRICVPETSSAWMAENKKHKIFKKTSSEIYDNLLDDDIYCKELFSILKNVKQIWVSGGEPLASETTLKFIKLCKKYNITDTNISFNTNLSRLTYKNHYWLDEFKDLKVSLTVSWDGFGKQMEYHRTGLNWKKSLQNFQEVFSIIHNINCVVSIYSIYTIPELISFCDKVNKELEINPVAGLGDILTVQSLPKIEKDKITKYYEKYFSNKSSELKNLAWNRVIIPMYKENNKEYLNTGFKQFNQVLDKYRGTNFVDWYPEYRDWWDSIK